MLALLSKAPGGPETLVVEEIADPSPARGEVRIAVEACGVNYPDVLIIEDRYQFKPDRPFSPGAEVSGRIDAIGEGVSGLKIGDRVLGGAGWNCMAEKVVLPENRCFTIPDSMPFDVASAFLMTYGTTIHALRNRADIRAGETLLVLGAAGGVGLAAVELGKAYGAKVIAAVSTPEKAQVAARHGADATIIYPADGLDAPAAREFLGRIRAEAPGGTDIVYDAVGGDYAEPALRSMAWEGRYLVIGFPAGIPRMPLNLPLLKGCSVLGVFWGEAIERSEDQHRRNVAELMRLYEAGHLHPLVSERYPLARGGEAISRLASRAAVGKIVVTL